MPNDEFFSQVLFQLGKLLSHLIQRRVQFQSILIVLIESVFYYEAG